MIRDRRTSDIAQGSTWNAREGEASAIVIRTVMGYVFYVDHDGATRVMYHARFRAEFIEPYDAQHCRSQFSMSLANLANFHLFWSPSRRRMFARSATCTPEEVRKAARGRPALPADAIYVNTYAEPIEPDDFLKDLNDVIASLDRAPAF